MKMGLRRSLPREGRVIMHKHTGIRYTFYYKKKKKKKKTFDGTLF
jgi:hypothetical protein